MNTEGIMYKDYYYPGMDSYQGGGGISFKSGLGYSRTIPNPFVSQHPADLPPTKYDNARLLPLDQPFRINTEDGVVIINKDGKSGTSLKDAGIDFWSNELPKPLDYNQVREYIREKNRRAGNIRRVAPSGAMYAIGGEMFNEDSQDFYRQGGIHIDPSKRGTFKAQATRMGMSVQQAANTILNAPEGKYSPEMRRKANFAKNFAKEEGGEPQNEGFQALPPEVQAKIMANMMYGGDMYGMGGAPCYKCGGQHYQSGGMFNTSSMHDVAGGIRDVKNSILGDTPEERVQTMKLAAKIIPMFLRKGGSLPKYQGQFGSSQVGSGMYGVHQEDRKLQDLADIYEQTVDEAPQYSSAENYLGFQNYLQTGEGNFDINPDYQYVGKQNPRFGAFQKNVEATRDKFKAKKSFNDFSLINQAGYVTGLNLIEALTRDNSGNKRYAAMQTLADNYAPTQAMNPFDWYGTYVTNQEDLINPRQITPVQFRGMDYPMYREHGGEIEMTDKQIKQLVALGAEIEFLD